MKSKLLNQKGFAPILLLVLVVLVAAGFLGYQAIVQKSPPPSTSQSIQARPNPPKPAGMILGAKTTKSLDPKTGRWGREVSTFSTKDPVVFLALQVNKAPKGTKFEYVRYFKGKYVDHKSLESTKDGVDYVSFSWSLKDIKSKHPAGDYRVKLYTNGKFEKEVSYQVR